MARQPPCLVRHQTLCADEGLPDQFGACVLCGADKSGRAIPIADTEEMLNPLRFTALPRVLPVGSITDFQALPDHCQHVSRVSFRAACGDTIQEMAPVVLLLQLHKGALAASLGRSGHWRMHQSL
jgi:hypothetical protein